MFSYAHFRLTYMHEFCYYIHYSGYHTHVTGVITQSGGAWSMYVTTFKVSTSMTTNTTEFERSQEFVTNKNGSEVITALLVNYIAN